MRHASGFTLIEILLVMAVIGIVAGLSAPLISGAMDQYYMTSAGQQVASTIRAARFQAVARNETLEIQFDAETGEYRVFENDGVTPAGEVQRLPTDISFGDEVADIEIEATGRAPDTCPCTIVVTNDNEDTRTITVATSGRVRLQ